MVTWILFVFLFPRIFTGAVFVEEHSQGQVITGDPLDCPLFSILQHCSVFNVHHCSLYSFPLFGIVQCSALFTPILWYSVPQSSIVHDCEQFTSSIISLFPPPSLQHCFPSFPVRGFVLQSPCTSSCSNWTRAYTHCKSFQLSNNVTVLCQKKDRKSTLLEMFFLALIQILMQAVVRIWLLVGLMYLLDPPQDPPVSAH